MSTLKIHRHAPIRILIADDDALFRRIVVSVLEVAGYETAEATSASEAQEQLHERAFDLLIADVYMPGNEDLALVHEQAEVPVLIVTGTPSLETAVSALRGAAVDYLAKPFSPDRLLERVAHAIELGRRMRQFRAYQAKQGEHASAPGLPPTVAKRLSPRERQALIAFVRTPRLSEVASQLQISQHTVKNHFRSIYRKLGVGSQAELLAHLAHVEATS